MRSRASRRRLSDHDIRCSASDRRWFPARPAQHVHRRRNNGRGPNTKRQMAGRDVQRRTRRSASTIQSAARDTAVGRLTAAPRGSASLPRHRCGNASRHAAPCSAGRAGAHRPSEALHPTRSSDVLPRIARERVPTVPHLAKPGRNGPPRIARERVLTSPAASANQIGKPSVPSRIYSGAEKQSYFPRRRYANTPTRRHASPAASNPRVLCLTNILFGQQWHRRFA